MWIHHLTCSVNESTAALTHQQPILALSLASIFLYYFSTFLLCIKTNMTNTLNHLTTAIKNFILLLLILYVNYCYYFYYCYWYYLLLTLFTYSVFLFPLNVLLIWVLTFIKMKSDIYHHHDRIHICKTTWKVLNLTRLIHLTLHTATVIIFQSRSEQSEPRVYVGTKAKQATCFVSILLKSWNMVEL